MQDEKAVAMKFNTWFTGLQPEMKDEIKKLHKKEGKWNLIILLFLGMWAGAGFLMYLDTGIITRIFCYIVIGLALHGMANLMHECMHDNLFNSKKLNWIYGFFAGLPSFFSITAYKVNHLRHHKYTGTDKDPDELFNITSNKILLRIVFYVILFLGVVLYLFHVPVNALRYGTWSDRRQILFEYAIMFGVYTAVILLSLQYNFFDVVLNVWMIPIIFAVLFGNIRAWAEHMLTDKSDLLLSTRTVTSTGLFSLLNLNLNYHLEHHLFPNIPWYNLPALHKMLHKEYNAHGVVIQSSYLLFLWEAFKKGPFRVI